MQNLSREIYAWYFDNFIASLLDYILADIMKPSTYFCLLRKYLIDSNPASDFVSLMGYYTPYILTYIV